ncbi:hypothetical protein K2F40_02940 [Clostridium sp. CM028]|uniref:hypothetical protein n=1 Tax=Clostridium sp. CM028 TaxID=2851575 RepID=UPI001C6E5B50|nr:hypothetical protein [Clostridium sp. CM028]MBW9147937.1 hypothetical protein [Clostridium sp. CM028]WLC61370.1 hypothetical protein KTC94_14995 [Clostridium sp. CM028]
MSKKCAICGVEIGFSLGEFISDKYVCNTCYELNEKKKLSEQKEENKETGSNMGRGLSYMADAFKDDEVFTSSVNKK